MSINTLLEEHSVLSGGSKGGALLALPGPKFLYFHAVFGEKLVKWYVGAPSGVGAPLGNPGL